MTVTAKDKIDLGLARGVLCACAPGVIQASFLSGIERRGPSLGQNQPYQKTPWICLDREALA